MSTGQKKNKVVKASFRDPAKEGTYRQLATLLTDLGYAVRREQLKQGHGWRVVSGDCQLCTEEDSANRIIFVDRRLSQDDQIEFLLGYLVNHRSDLPEEQLRQLPERIVRQLGDRCL